MSSDAIASSTADPRRRPLRAVLAVTLALAAVGAFAGCGKRGDPAPPLRYVPQTTDQLSVSQRHLELLLELPYPKTTAAGTALPGLSRIEVWEARRVAPGAVTPVEEAEPVEVVPVEPVDDPTDEAAGEEMASATQTSAPLEAAAALPELDQRAFLARATLRASVEGAELAEVVIGERIVISLPLPAAFPEVPEIHYFAVRTVVGEEDRSELSNQVAIVPRVPPPPPGGLVAEAAPGGVRLTWRGNGPEVVGYDVYRRSARERTFLDPIDRLDANVTESFDSTARFGESYIYGVTAVADRAPLIASAIGSTVEVDYRDRFAPAPPAGLVALVEEGRVRLAWEAAGAADLAGYRVVRGSAGGTFAPVGGGLVSGGEWVDEAVTAGTIYTWRVTSVDVDGNESAAAEVTAEAR